MVFYGNVPQAYPHVAVCAGHDVAGQHICSPATLSAQQQRLLHQPATGW
jgi:hypothetical protein